MNIVSIGRSAEPMSDKLLSASQTKRLELRHGAEELKDKDLRDLAAEREHNPRLLVFTPKPGTQQDLSLQDGLWASTVTDWTEALPFLHETETLLLTGLLTSSL